MPAASWPPHAGLIFCCALGDELARRAREGDGEALEDLIAAARDIPPGLRRRIRDRHIKRLADRLTAARPGWSVNRVASLLSEAGDRLQRGRGIDGAPFDELTKSERTQLAHEIGKMLEWLPARAGGAWPCLRQLTEIVRPFAKIADETANPVDEG